MIQSGRKNNPEVTKEDLLERVSGTQKQEHLMASLEYMFDLVLDMSITMMDNMIANNNITLSENELANYNKLKALQSQLHTFDLENAEFPDGRGVNVLDYIYGLKQSIMTERIEYFKLKDKYNL